MRKRPCTFVQRRFFVPHGTSFKIIGVLLGELGAEAADAAIQMAFHQRLKGREVAPLDGVDEVVMVGHHLGEPAGGQSAALEGAVFTVANRRTGTTQTVATDGAGQIRLTDLDKSTTYLIREQQAPENYRPDDTDHTVTVAADGRIDGAGSTTLDITNRLLRAKAIINLVPQ